jgi:hypothetical protein
VRGVLGNRYPYRDNMQVDPTMYMKTQARRTTSPSLDTLFSTKIRALRHKLNATKQESKRLKHFPARHCHLLQLFDLVI